MHTNVLLVEDDDRIREALALALADEDFTVVQATSGEEGLSLLGAGSVHVVLLDLMLPGVDGLSVCRTLRARGDLPIIVVTARSDTTDVIAGLEAGADDYVTKPLVASVLAARIRALLRRHRDSGAVGSPHTDRLRVRDLEILAVRGVVRRAGVEVHLTRTEFRLLLELANSRGNIVSREDLLERVWGYDYYGDTRLLDVHIRRLRRKIETNPHEPELVLTVRGAGYKTCQP
ncbi:response regulator transcription factor [Pseudonocardia eucalypti]|uniref:Response regulator transcription factor n=1 Tax=Pseudonocardia eucalypti TaxID=648755 RepID=A0ABP9PJ19_9PSEU|nr:DNA-binding response OmpR family regulator [Pseudonocardia eucalypti]